MRHNARSGDIAEAVFGLRSMQRGWVVSKPSTEKQAYDHIIDNRHNLLRIQVKSTETSCSKNRYRINIGRGKHTKIAYSKKDIDFFAIYLLPEDAWYIFPVEFAAGRVGLSVPKADHAQGTKYEPFLNAWHSLDGNPSDPNSYANQTQASKNHPAQCDPNQCDPIQNDPTQDEDPDEPWSPSIDIKACAEEYDPHPRRKPLIQ